ncbi:MAG: hypothetical protein FWF69_06320 [Firmicutes bacterium]|nr:hypothetical protein [Bacillota bacterium]
MCDPCDYFCRYGVSISRACPNSGPCFDFSQCCDLLEEMPAYAYLTHSAAFSLQANAPVPFTGPKVQGNSVEHADGVLRITKPGVYHVRYNVKAPAGTLANTTFVLRADGEDIAGTQRAVSGGGADAMAEAIIEVAEAAALGLYSTNAVNFPASRTGESLATMTVTEL